MKRAILVLTGLLVLFMAAVSASAFAAGADSDEKEIERVRRKIEALRAWQLTDELKLTPETSALLFPMMRETDEERFRVEAVNRNLLREMERELDRAVPDQVSLDNFLDRLLENRRESERVEERHLRRVREVLSPEDTVRYLLFTIRFENDIRERVSRMRQEAEAPGQDRGDRGSGRSRTDGSDDSGGGTSGGSGGQGGSGGGSGGPSGGSGSRGRGR